MNCNRCQSAAPLLLAFVTLLFISCQGPAGVLAPPPAKRPNVLVILADDAGYGDFGFQGADDLETPHLDRLAAAGTIFTQAYVSASVCSPSRAGLLTGRYQQRFGHECNLEPSPLAFDTSQVTLAEALGAEGYGTAIFGKWHLGSLDHQHPLRNGFDHFYGFISGGRSYFPLPAAERGKSESSLQLNHTPQVLEGYLTDDLGEKAADYITERAAEKQPFFAYLAFNAPHTPMQATEADIARFPDHPRPVYAAMVYAMDRAVGKVMQALQESGSYDDTLIFFLSDNGGAHNNDSSVGQLKGWKGNQYEGGIRVPFVVSWPGHVPRGATHLGMVSSLDIFATALEAAGMDRPTGLDGVSLLPLLQQEDRTVDAHQTLFWRKDEMATVRRGKHKLIRLDDFGTVVYGTSTDNAQFLDEGTKLEGPESMALRDSLAAALSAWEEELVPPHWDEGEPWNAVTRYIYRQLMTNQPVLAKSPPELQRLAAEDQDSGTPPAPGSRVSGARKTSDK